MHGLWDQPEIPTVPLLTRARAQTHAHAGDQAAQSGAAMHHFLLIHYTHTQRRREEKKNGISGCAVALLRDSRRKVRRKTLGLHLRCSRFGRKCGLTLDGSGDSAPVPF